MKSFDKAILESGFDLEEYLNKRSKFNRKKYPPEFYKKIWEIVTNPNEENSLEKFAQLIKEYNYKP
ncbi:MAG: hypothetical protein ACI4S3_02885 [Candidatus Gastranaerophilaceae bacterium]